MIHRIVRGTTLTLLCAFAASARAEDHPVARAKALFLEGRALARDGNFADACPKFDESARLDPGIGTQFNLADCWEHTGKRDRARELFLDVASRAHDLGQLDREEAARARAAALPAPQPAPAPGTIATAEIVIHDRADVKSRLEEMASDLDEEHRQLTEAVVTLAELRDGWSKLSRMRPRDRHLHEVEKALDAAERDLDAARSLAGHLTTQIARRTAPAPVLLRRSASDGKPVPGPTPTARR